MYRPGVGFSGRTAPRGEVRIYGVRRDLGEEAEAGFEPANNGFAIRSEGDVTPDESSTSEQSQNGLSLGLLLPLQNDPELQAVVLAWPALPPDVRKMIVGVVRLTPKTAT